MRTVTTATNPARMSSRSIFIFGVFEIDLELARVVFHRLANLLGDALQEAVHMGAAARRVHDVHEALHGGVVAVRPPHGDIDVAGSHDLLRVQVAAFASTAWVSSW